MEDVYTMAIINQHSTKKEVLTAVKKEAFSLLNAHPLLQQDRELILEAAHNNACVIKALNMDTETSIIVYALVNLRQSIHPKHHPTIRKGYKIELFSPEKITYIEQILKISEQLFITQRLSDDTLLYALLSTELLLYRPESTDTIDDFVCCAKEIKHSPKLPLTGSLMTSLGGGLLGVGIIAALVSTSLLPVAAIAVTSALGLVASGCVKEHVPMDTSISKLSKAMTNLARL